MMRCMPSRPAAAPARPAPYARVKQHLRAGLAAGRWAAGARMPSESALTAQFGVSRMTVNRALRELQAEGLLDRVQGVGTFAALPGRVASTLTIRDLHEEITARGHVHEARVAFVREEAASPALALQLGLAPGAAVFHSLITHCANGVAVQCEDRFVVPAWVPDYLGIDFTRTTPTQHLLRVAPLWQAQYTIEAAAPTAEEARLLGIARRTPCLVVVRRTLGPAGRAEPRARRPGRAAGAASVARPITLVRLVHPGPRWSLQGEFAP
jgi:GntR family histidine utilization transcriptional repressor